MFPDWDTVADEQSFALSCSPADDYSAAFRSGLSAQAGDQFTRRLKRHQRAAAERVVDHMGQGLDGNVHRCERPGVADYEPLFEEFRSAYFDKRLPSEDHENPLRELMRQELGDDLFSTNPSWLTETRYRIYPIR